MKRLDDSQLELGPAIAAVHRANGNRLRALLVHALQANGISRSDVADETGIDNSHLTRMLDPDGANLPPGLIACVMAKDRAGVMVQGLAAMVGYEATPKKPDLAAENRALRLKLARLRAELDEVLDDVQQQ